MHGITAATRIPKPVYSSFFYREAARERRRPRREQLRILPPLKMLRLHRSSYACSIHLQPLPARAPALPGRFAVVQYQIFYSAGLISALSGSMGLQGPTACQGEAIGGLLRLPDHRRLG